MPNEWCLSRCGQFVRATRRAALGFEVGVLVGARDAYPEWLPLPSLVSGKRGHRQESGCLGSNL